jgi:hypothetical protein
MLLDPPGRPSPRPGGLHLAPGQPTVDLTPAPLPERRRPWRLAREAKVAIGCALLLGLLYLLAALGLGCSAQAREPLPSLGQASADLDRAGARLVAYRLDEGFFLALQRHREGKP